MGIKRDSFAASSTWSTDPLTQFSPPSAAFGWPFGGRLSDCLILMRIDGIIGERDSSLNARRASQGHVESASASSQEMPSEKKNRWASITFMGWGDWGTEIETLSLKEKFEMTFFITMPQTSFAFDVSWRWVCNAVILAVYVCVCVCLSIYISRYMLVSSAAIAFFTFTPCYRKKTRISLSTL